MEAPQLRPPTAPATDYDQCVLLRDVTWAEYEAHAAARGESAVPRLTYDRGVLEIMSPSKSHEHIKTTLGRLLEQWALETKTILEGYGSWTVMNPEVERGLEPDECYVLGEHNDAERPDLAIEVVWTSRLLDKLTVYAALGIPEVWVWEKDALAVHVLRDGRHERAARSALLPGVDLPLLARLASYESSTRAINELRELLTRG